MVFLDDGIKGRGDLLVDGDGRVRSDTFTSHFLNFLSTLGSVFQFFCHIQVPFVSFYPL